MSPLSSRFFRGTVLILLSADLAHAVPTDKKVRLPGNTTLTAIKAEKVQPMGRPVLITLVLTNKNTKTTAYAVGSTPYPELPWDLHAVVTDSQAKTRSLLLYNSNHNPGSRWPKRLKPGDSVDTPALLLPLAAGAYTVRVQDSPPLKLTIKDDPALARRRALKTMEGALSGNIFDQFVIEKFPTKQTTEMLLKAMLSDNGQRARVADYLLIRLQDLPPETGPLILKAMRHELKLDKDQRHRNVSEAGRLAMLASSAGTDDALQAVLEFLKQDPEMAGWRTIMELAHFKQPSATRALHDYLKNTDLTRRFAAARALAPRKDPLALPVLLEVAGQSGQWQGYALQALVNYPQSKEARAVLKEGVHAADSFSRSEASMALNQLRMQAKPGQGRPEFRDWMFGFTGPSSLTYRPAVRKDLHMTAEQIQKLKGLGEQTEKRYDDWLRSAGNDRDKMTDVQEELFKQQLNVLAKVLTPAQRQRLWQINVQMMWPWSILIPKIRSQLRVTSLQELQLREIYKQHSHDLGRVENGPLLSPEVAKQKTAAIEERTQKAYANVLTPEQQKKWRELIGKPFHEK
jgi:hypothetical protein